MSVRLKPKTALPYAIDYGGGNLQYSQVFQVKSTDPDVYGQPVMQMLEGRNGLKFVYHVGSTVNEYLFSPSQGVSVPRGKWLRIGLDLYPSSSANGAYRVWGDLDGDSIQNWRPLTPKVSGPTIIAGYDSMTMNLGPYHRLSLPANGRGYGDVELLQHSAADGW